MTARQSYGTGSLWERGDQGGAVTWYGEWRADVRKVRRSVGPKRAEGGSEGLTRTQAERELRRPMAEGKPSSGAGDRLTLEEVASPYRAHVEALGRKRSTLTALDSTLRVWLVKRLGDRSLDRIRPEDVEEMMRAMCEAKVGRSRSAAGATGSADSRVPERCDELGDASVVAACASVDRLVVVEDLEWPVQADGDVVGLQDACEPVGDLAKLDEPCRAGPPSASCARATNRAPCSASRPSQRYLAPADLVDEHEIPPKGTAVAAWLTQQRGKPTDCARLLRRWLCPAAWWSTLTGEGHPLRGRPRNCGRATQSDFLRFRFTNPEGRRAADAGFH